MYGLQPTHPYSNGAKKQQLYFTVKAKCIRPYAVKLGDGRVTRYEEMALIGSDPQTASY